MLLRKQIRTNQALKILNASKVSLLYRISIRNFSYNQSTAAIYQKYENFKNKEQASTYFNYIPNQTLQELNKHGKYSMVESLKQKYKDQHFWSRSDYKEKIQTEYRFASNQLQKISSPSSKQNSIAILLNFFLKYGARILIFLYFASSIKIGETNWSTITPFIKIRMEKGIRETINTVKKKFDQAIQQVKQKLSEIIDQQLAYEVIKPESIQQNLQNVVGIDQCKKQVEQVIKFIKEKQVFLQKGAKLPKGILLYGDPGVGKTLLARAIAKQSKVQFIYQNGSAFDQIYVGSGSRRIRQLFAKAREIQPCIVFIDEIDSLLSKTRRANESSSSRSVVNGFLSQLDGFKQSQNIVLIGATNHLDMIDQAAQRAGRMDMKIYVPKPDQKGRTALYQLFLKRAYKIQQVVKPQFLAKITPGFTGAEIKNLVNTAICDRVHKTFAGKFGTEKNLIGIISQQDLIESRDKILMGIERKTLSMSDFQRLNTAIHQTGHTLTAMLTKGANIIQKVTIVPRSNALGVTLMIPDQSQERTLNKESLIAMIDVAMGGHIAEKIFIGDEQITSGCSNDLAKATQYAKMAVRQYGMFADNKAGFIASSKEDVSEDFNSNIDNCVRQVLNQSAERVHKLLLKNKKSLMNVSRLLYLHDTLTKNQITQIMTLSQSKIREKFKKIEQKRPWTAELERKFMDINKRLEPNRQNQKRKDDNLKEVQVEQDLAVQMREQKKPEIQQKNDSIKNTAEQQDKTQEKEVKNQEVQQQPDIDYYSQKNLFNPASNKKRI